MGKNAFFVVNAVIVSKIDLASPKEDARMAEW